MLPSASKGDVNKAVLVSSYADALQRFGPYDSFLDPTPSNPTNPRANSLTLVRALELAFKFGATTVFAVRIGTNTTAASFKVTSGSGDNVTLTAKTPGTWANALSVNVSDAEEDGFVENETVPVAGAGALTLKRTKVVK